MRIDKRLPTPGGDDGIWPTVLNEWGEQVREVVNDQDDRLSALEPLFPATQEAAAATQLAKLAAEAAAATAIERVTVALAPTDTQVADLVGTPASATAAALKSTYAPQPASYIDARDLPDGAVTALSRGTFAGSFGNSPASIDDGAIVHTPIGTANAASYIQAQLSGPVATVSALAEWEATATGSVALVVPLSAWSDGVFTDAGVHVVVTADGFVTSSRFEEGVGLVNAVNGQVGSMVGGTHKIDVTLNYRQNEISVYVDSVLATRHVDATAFTMVGTHAIWELYEEFGASDVPARLLAASAATEQRVNPAAPIVSAATLSPDGFAEAFAPGTPVNWVVPVSAASIADGALATLVTFPPSGKLLIRLVINLTLSAADNVLVIPTTNGVSGNAVSVAHSAGSELRSIETIVTGEPNTPVILDWTAFKVGAADCTFHLSGEWGAAVVAALPVR